MGFLETMHFLFLDLMVIRIPPSIRFFFLGRDTKRFASKNAKRFSLHSLANKPHCIFTFERTKQTSLMLEFGGHVEMVVNSLLSKFHHQQTPNDQVMPKLRLQQFCIFESNKGNWGWFLMAMCTYMPAHHSPNFNPIPYDLVLPKSYETSFNLCALEQPMCFLSTLFCFNNTKLLLR